MAAKKEKLFVTVLLLIVLCANLLNVQVARADGETPTEPPAPTQVETEAPPASDQATELPPTEPSVEATLAPVQVTPVPEQITVPPNEELLTQVPESTEVVVLDEEGNPIPLATQEATEIIEVFDPMWCPVVNGIPTLPGGPGCSKSYMGLTPMGDLVADMAAKPADFASNGIIYFQETTGSSTTGESFALTRSILGGTANFNTLNVFNLTLQGGWNGLNDSTATFTGQTNFGGNSITVGSAGTGTRWLGNVTLNNFLFSGGTQPSVVVYTAGGNITLDNVDVLDHGGDTNTAILNSVSGNIIVENGSTFDGNATNSRGFSATTAGSGSITISDSTFKEIVRNGNNTDDGARLTASTVTLTNVTAKDNDGNGIRIDSANLVTLNNVMASNNGTGTNYSGVYMNGNLVNGIPVSRLIIVGGTFSGNHRYGIQAGNTTIYVQSAPTCDGNRVACYNVTPILDSTAPTITPNITGTAGASGWYRSDVSVSWSFADPESGILSSSGCSSTTISTETSGTTLTCSATNNAGLSNSASVTIKIDKTSPTLSLPNITAEATGSTGSAVSYSASAMDAVDGSMPASCSPVSGSVFPLGTTTVNCSATDSTGNISSAAFLVTVQDTTAPSIAPHADVTANARGKTGANVSYTSPSTLDAVDGHRIASCAPASGSFFEIGTTQVICAATDSHGNSAMSTFFIYVDRSSQTSALESSSSPASIVPLTSGQAIALDCNSKFWAFGIKLSFTQLCDHQANVHQVTANNLPAPLPDASSVAIGLSVDVLNNGQLLEDLPDGASIQMDFPLAGGSKDQFAVLHWNGSEWIEVSAQNGTNASLGMLSITSDTTGIFILVKK